MATVNVIEGGYRQHAEQDWKVAAEEKRKTATKSCLRTITFVQFWIGGLLAILGISLVCTYAILLFLAVLVDGIITLSSAALGAVSVYYSENHCVRQLRMSLCCLQVLYGVVFVFLYIWGAVDLHIAFVAFVIFECIQVIIAILVLLIYTNHLHISTICCDIEENEPQVPTTQINSQPIQSGVTRTQGNTTVAVNAGVSYPPYPGTSVVPSRPIYEAIPEKNAVYLDDPPPYS